MPLRPRWRSVRRSSGSCIVIVSFRGGATLEEVAVVGELADERIDLAQRERRRGMALEVAADELVGGAEVEGDGARGVDGGGAVRAGEREQPLDAPARRAGHRRRGARWRAARRGGRSSPPAPGGGACSGGVRRGRSSGCSAYCPRCWRSCSRSSAPVARIEDAHHALVPLHGDHARRCARAGRGSTPCRPRRSRRGARCGCRRRSSETASAAAAGGAAAPRRTSRRPGAWWCRGCGCRPSASPSDRGTPAPSARRSKRSPLSGVRCAWPTPDSTLPLRSGSPTRHGSAMTP